MKTIRLDAQTPALREGVRLSAREAGMADRPVVVLLPGWPQTSYAWRHVQPLLAKAGYRSLAIDLPGMGESEFLPQGRTYDTGVVADLLAAAVASNGIDRFVLVGHDVGTWVAYAWATRQPRGITHLCLLEAAVPGVTPESAFGIANAPRIFQFYFNAVEELPELLTNGREREFLGWLFHTKSTVRGTFGQADVDEYVRSYSAPGRMSAGFHYYRAVPKSMEQNRAAAPPTMPLLALGGDGSVGDKLYQALKPNCPQTQGGALQGVGHYIPEEAAPVLVASLLKFIQA